MGMREYPGYAYVVNIDKLSEQHSDIEKAKKELESFFDSLDNYGFSIGEYVDQEILADDLPDGMMKEIDTSVENLEKLLLEHIEGVDSITLCYPPIDAEGFSPSVTLAGYYFEVSFPIPENVTVEMWTVFG